VVEVHPMNEQYLTEDEFREFLRVVVEQAGGATEFCAQTGFDRSALHKVLSGKLPPQPKLLKQMTANGLGIEERRVYALPEGWVKWRAAPHSLTKA
jgi:predicted transcriptional regulator